MKPASRRSNRLVLAWFRACQRLNGIRQICQARNDCIRYVTGATIRAEPDGLCPSGCRACYIIVVAVPHVNDLVGCNARLFKNALKEQDIGFADPKFLCAPGVAEVAGDRGFTDVSIAIG